MSIIISDSFNRADSTTTLGNADTGQTWQVEPATTVWGINSNQAYCQNSVVSGTAGTFAWIDAGVSDGYVQCTMPVWPMFGAFKSAALGFRRVDATHLWFARHDRLFVNTGGGFTEDGTYSSFFGDGDTMRIECSGTDITVYKNGVSVLALAGRTANQAGTGWGLNTGDLSQVGRWDNFEVGGFRGGWTVGSIAF